MPATRPDPRKAILVVIDGLTPSLFEAAVGDGTAPTLAALAGRGSYAQAASTFPSLTPVCLSSLATGAHPDVHHIPHLVWYSREERRVIEYGSSFAAVRRAGTFRSLRDAIFTMNERHLSREATTVYEAVEDAGLTAAAINITCYRGRTRHLPTVPGLTPAAYGPKRFFYYSLFESDPTGAPLAVRNRAAGSIDEYAAAVGRWLVTRDGFDLLVLYLSDVDFASHAFGPNAADEALARCDVALGGLVEAAGGLDDFLARYAVVVCSDHGQTGVSQVAQLEDSFAGVEGALVTASNRAGMVYRLPGCTLEASVLAERLDGVSSVEVAFYREGGEAIARRAGEELRFAPAEDGWRTSGDQAILDQPDALTRVWAALANPNAGEVLVSATPGYEFSDLAGRHHAGGGSHGSLVAGDSLVPMVTVNLPRSPASITGVAPLLLEHLGIEPPRYASAGDAARAA